MLQDARDRADKRQEELKARIEQQNQERNANEEARNVQILAGKVSFVTFKV